MLQYTVFLSGVSLYWFNLVLEILVGVGEPLRDLIFMNKILTFLTNSAKEKKVVTLLAEYDYDILIEPTFPLASYLVGEGISVGMANQSYAKVVYRLRGQNSFVRFEFADDE